MKRALPGTLIAPLTNPGSIAEITIKIVSISLFFLFCVGMLWISVRIIKKSHLRINAVLVTLVFLTSPYIVMSAHLNGYFDNILIILSVLACWLVIRNQIWPGAIVLSVGMLVHETIFLVGFPSVVFLALMQHAKEADHSSPARFLIGALWRYRFLVIIPALTFSLLILYQTAFFDSEVLKPQLIAHLSQFEFIENHRNIFVPNDLTATFFDYLDDQSPSFFNRITDRTNIIRIGLPLLILLRYGWHSLKGVAFKRLIFSIFTVITILPLSLHSIAWDTNRIWTYPLIVAMIGLWEIREMFPPEAAKKNDSLFFCIIMLMVMVSQFFLSTPLMDHVQERFSNEKRVVLYAPSLISMALFFSKHYNILSKDRGAID